MSVERIQQHFRDSAALKLEALDALAVPIAAAIDTLFGALAYFVSPIDLIPVFLLGIGYTDDAAVLAMAIGLVAKHITPAHRARAHAALDLPPEQSP